MGRIFTAFFLVFSIAFIMAGCAPPKKAQHTPNMPGDGGKPVIAVQADKDKGDFKTVEIDGREMLQSRGESGEFGGTFYAMQIGDGPKTFNGWASYDATSSEMADMMFAGLFSTDAYTGEVVPY